MTAVIDGATIESRQQLHDAMAEQLALPEWYGRNLDALFDCLTDRTDDVELVIRNRRALFASLGIYAQVLEDMLGTAAEENPRIFLRFEEE